MHTGEGVVLIFLAVDGYLPNSCSKDFIIGECDPILPPSYNWVSPLFF